MNFLGVDWGKSKIGLAFGNDENKIATPFKVIRFKTYKEVVEKVQEFVESEQIGGIIIGQPKNLAGEEFFSGDFEKFLIELKLLDIPIYFEDERLSTKAALKKSFDRPRKQRADDDDLAAAEILQAYFDKL